MFDSHGTQPFSARLTLYIMLDKLLDKLMLDRLIHPANCPDCMAPNGADLNGADLNGADLKGADLKLRQLAIAFCLILGFSALELAVGWYSHSLSLLAESEHLLSDGLGLGVALFATWISRLPAAGQATFGYRRAEVLAALFNSVVLLLVAGWIAWEAIARLGEPVEILSLPMIGMAIAGLIVNLLSASLLHSHSHSDLNIRGAFLHMLVDAFSSVGVLIAAIAVWQLHWTWADGVMSLVVALFIVVATVPLLQQSLHILLEKAPVRLDLDQVQQTLLGFAEVTSIRNLRVWTIALGQESLSAQLIVAISTGNERDRLLQKIQVRLQEEYGLTEICLQMTAQIPVVPINLSQGFPDC
jgi:cobalt-zinc-cadmium efflux system protein